jgi:hypothetical protein
MTYEEMLAFADTVARAAPPLAPPAEAAPPAETAPAIAAEAAPAAEVAGPPVAPIEAATIEAAPLEAAPVAEAALADPAAVPEATPAVAVLPADVPGLAAAIRPFARPVATVQLVTAAAAAEAVPAAATPAEATPAVATTAAAPEPVAATAAPEPVAEAAAPATPVALTQDIPVGTPLVQLGAFDSAEIAASEWTRLQGAFGEFLGPRERVVQETESSGRTFYRLRATGFTDLADARRLCAALTAEGADCLPLTVN